VTLVSSILPLVALFQVFDGLSATTAGILRARGKQALGALLNLSAYYVLGIPFGLLLTFKVGMQLMGLWIGLTVALVYSTVVGLWLCLKTDWDKEVRKVVERMEKERLVDERYRDHANGDAPI
jgi:multidrug resistance protein, MATE family